MEIAIFVILIISLLVTVVKVFNLSITTGVTSGINKSLKVKPSEEDIQQEKLWNKYRGTYVIIAIITLVYSAYILW